MLVDGRRFAIAIYRTEDRDFWTLEVVNYDGKSRAWSEQFVAEQAALDAALATFEDEGAAGFV